MNYDFSRPLRIATRQSPLALWQAEHVKARLEKMYPQLTVELLKMTTKGDILLGSPLSKIGGKGLFLKELEVAMEEGKADLAVHSAKDMPAMFPVGFTLAAILEREEPEDAMVSNKYSKISVLPADAIVGTCSLRRQCQLLERFPQFQIRDLRGNVGTRLSKLDAGEYDAIVLARAGLMRLNLHDRIAEVLSTEVSLPAVGQGAVAIECLEGSPAFELVQGLADQKTTWRVLAERAMNRTLEGGCQVPLAGYASLQQGEGSESLEDMMLTMKGLVGKPDGSVILRAQVSGNITDAEAIGAEVAKELLKQGAGEILSSLS